MNHIRPRRLHDVATAVLTKFRHARYLALVLTAALLGPLINPLVAQFYQKTFLVSDVPGLAKNTDSHLIVGWGLDYLPGGPWWVAATRAGDALVFDGTGASHLLPSTNSNLVMIDGPAMPSMPTGVVADPGNEFDISLGEPAKVIFVTLLGTIDGWNSGSSASIVVNNHSTAKYAGATLAEWNNAEMLYVANFGQDRVDVFDGQFSPVTLPSGAFTDPTIPSTDSVFNVENVNGMLYVAYAPMTSMANPTGPGPGMGYVDVYTVGGTLVRRLRHGWWMDAPWGVTTTPADFGKFSNDVLVGMFGNGHIAAFSPKTGNFLGLMRTRHGKPLTIFRGLWDLGFGNGAMAGPTNALYFASGLMMQGNHHGVFGKITVMPPSDNRAMNGHSDRS